MFRVNIKMLLIVTTLILFLVYDSCAAGASRATSKNWCYCKMRYTQTKLEGEYYGCGCGLFKRGFILKYSIKCDELGGRCLNMPTPNKSPGKDDEAPVIVPTHHLCNEGTCYRKIPNDGWDGYYVISEGEVRFRKVKLRLTQRRAYSRSLRKQRSTRRQ